MARVSVTTQRITRAGLDPDLTQPTVDGDIIDTGNVALWVDNASGGSINVTVQTPGTDPATDVARPELIRAVPAGEFRLIGPFPVSLFAQPADAAVGPLRVLVDYSAQASVTRGVVSF
jgi:hypothetical protein